MTMAYEPKDEHAPIGPVFCVWIEKLKAKQIKQVIK